MCGGDVFSNHWLFCWQESWAEDWETIDGFGAKREQVQKQLKHPALKNYKHVRRLLDAYFEYL